MRLLPRSLLGQVLLALASALLIAQAISATMLYRAAAERRELAFMNAAAFQLLRGPRDGRERGVRFIRPPRGLPPGMEGDGPVRIPRMLRYSESPVLPFGREALRDAERESEFAKLLDARGVEVAEVAITLRAVGDDPEVRRAMRSYPGFAAAVRERDLRIMTVALKTQGSAAWQIVRVPIPDIDRGILRSLVLQTALLFLTLVGLIYFVLRRITRPLDALAERTRRFGGAGAPEEPLAPSGPEDVRWLIEAHNSMQARIGSMLDEKDVMLGAIGHDLKTPLAALRVRIESVEDEAARGKMAATIEDITRTLDEILSLARIGRPTAEPEMTELGALAASVVEEFEDLDQPVQFETEGRVAAPVHLTWLKRGLRNLITNALRYAGTAEVRVRRDGDTAILSVADRGPGIPEDRIADMLEPFTRGEASRNRETGGAGLGLTLARAVAEQHGGTLTLANRPEGGILAEIRVPIAA